MTRLAVSGVGIEIEVVGADASSLVEIRNQVFGQIAFLTLSVAILVGGGVAGRALPDAGVDKDEFFTWAAIGLGFLGDSSSQQQGEGVKFHAD